MKAYVIGGSPCSGKSTIANHIADIFGLSYFKVDDRLEHYTDIGAERGYDICSKIHNMTAEETWMRSPQVQAEDELTFYKEIFPLILQDMDDFPSPLIAEGAAFLPELVKEVPVEGYICITPTKQFQVEHYRQRKWVKYVLQDCSDPQKAFENWMERDILFAAHVRQMCKDFGVTLLIADGTQTTDKQMESVLRHFMLH